MALSRVVSDEPYRILSIDPGNDTLGMAWIEVRLDIPRAVVIEACTFSGVKRARWLPSPIYEIHGQRHAQQRAHAQTLQQALLSFKPHTVVCEAPYLGQHATPFAALTECVAVLRDVVYRTNALLPFEQIDPATVKVAVGVSGKNGNKSLMLEGIQRHSDLVISEGVLDHAQEHGIDAIAVGYYKAKQVIEYIRNPPCEFVNS